MPPLQVFTCFLVGWCRQFTKEIKKERGKGCSKVEKYFNKSINMGFPQLRRELIK